MTSDATDVVGTMKDIPNLSLTIPILLYAPLPNPNPNPNYPNQVGTIKDIAANEGVGALYAGSC